MPLPSPGAATPPSTASAVDVVGTSLRVLVVDDNTDAADMLAEVLMHFGCTTRVAHDAPEALKALDAFCPDVALLDIGLPVMDGYELARRLRQRPALTHLHLVAVTGNGQPQDRERSSDVGFDSHLVKPVSTAQIREMLAKLAPLATHVGVTSNAQQLPMESEAAGPRS